MATCSMVLLSVLKTASGLISEQEEAAFMAACHRFATTCAPAPALTHRLPQVTTSCGRRRACGPWLAGLTCVSQG